MATPEKINITDDTRLIDLTVGDLRALIREEVREVMADALEDYDPDAGLEFKPEVAAQLEEYLRERPDGEPAEDVMRELGLLDE